MNKKTDNISHGKPSAGLNPLKASQLSDSAKIRTDIEETKFRLKEIAEKWKGINTVHGFLKDFQLFSGVYSGAAVGRGMPRRELSKKGVRAGQAEGAVTGWSMATDRHDGVCLTTLDGAEGHG